MMAKAIHIVSYSLLQINVCMKKFYGDLLKVSVQTWFYSKHIKGGVYYIFGTY